ncbi:MAG: iron-sulfur cluster assembly scaffold protein [Nitrospirota bacterium]
MRYAVPLLYRQGDISEHFGSSPFIALWDKRISDGKVISQEILENPFLEMEKGKGIKLAEFLVEHGVDILYTKKHFEHKGPEYVFSNAEVMEDADGFASMISSCGDTMEIWLKINNDIIIRATFMTNGCGTTIASGSMVTEISKGKSIKEALKISQQDILDALGGLPEGNRHCALLAANTLKEAISEYMAVKKDPWKRAYRKYFRSRI